MSALRPVERIYFVDDSDDEIFITKIAFERQGIAAELLHYFDLDSYFEDVDARSDEEMKVAMTVLDLNLTSAHGTEGLSRLRSHPVHSAHIAGICSGSDDPADQQSAQSAGANFFVSKPLDRAALETICEAVPALHIMDNDRLQLLVDLPTETAI